MECFICDNPLLDNEAKAQLPCCNVSVHTICMLNFTDEHYYHNRPEVICDCGSILIKFKWEHNFGVTEEEILAKTNAKMSEPAFKKATKEALAKIRARNKARNIFTKLLILRSRGFKSEISTFLNTIKTTRTDAVNSIKASEEYKNFKKTISQTTRTINSFANQFALTPREATIHLRQERGRYWRSSLSWAIRRKFRINIY